MLYDFRDAFNKKKVYVRKTENDSNLIYSLSNSLRF